MGLMNKLDKLSKYSIAITFLSLEVFAFIAFSFGGSFLLYSILSLSLLVLLIIFNYKNLRDGDFYNVIFFLFPLFIFGLLTALGVFMKGHRIADGDFNVAETVFVPISLISMVMTGFFLAKDKNFKIKYFLLIVYGALAILVTINLFANLINFGPFYNVIYKGYYMYFAGLKSSVPAQDMAYTLEGFKIIEVDISHYLLYPILLLSSNFMLFNCSIKNEKKSFFTYLSFTLIALLALIFVPTRIGFIFMALALVIDGIIILFKKVERARKPLKYVFIAICLMVAIVFLMILLVNQDVFSGIRNVVSSNPVLNRLFITNRFASAFSVPLHNVIGENFLGFYSYKPNQYLDYYDVGALSGSFVFDSFMTSGVIGAIGLFVFIFLGFKAFKKYFLANKDEFKYSSLLLSFAITFFIFSGLFYEGDYGIYYSVFKPMFISGPFLIFVFVLSYVYVKGIPEKNQNNAKEVELKEEDNHEKE